MLFSCSMTPGNASTSCTRSREVKDESFVRSGQENTRKPVRSAKVYPHCPQFKATDQDERQFLFEKLRENNFIF